VKPEAVKDEMITALKNKTTNIKSFFYKGHERSIKAKRNIVFSFVIKGLNILISLILVPLTINYINPTQYGIWLTLSSIVSWMSFFDIGLGSGLRNKFTEAVTKGKHKLAKIYISTTYFILTTITISVFLSFLVINQFIDWAKILNTDSYLKNELSILAIIVVGFFCLQFVFQLITTIVTANQEPAKASLFGFIGNFFSLLVIYILTKTSNGSLLKLGFSLGIMPVIVLFIASLFLFSNEYKKYSPTIKFIKLKYAKNLTGLGLKFFFIQIAAIVLFQTNNIIIAQLFGPEQVTPYNIAFKYFGVITMIAGIIMTPFWSAFTEAWVKKDFEWIKNTVRKLQYLWVVLFLLSIVILFMSSIVYDFWLGDKVKISFSLSAAMCIYVLIIVWNMIYVQFINGVGKIRVQLLSSIFGTIMTIPLTYYFAKLYGINGIIIASCILGLTNTLWTYLQYKKLLTQTAKGIWNK